MALQKAAQQRLMEKEKNKSPSCAMRISLQINKVAWSMLVDGKSFGEAEINDMVSLSDFILFGFMFARLKFPWRFSIEVIPVSFISRLLCQTSQLTRNTEILQQNELHLETAGLEVWYLLVSRLVLGILVLVQEILSASTQ